MTLRTAVLVAGIAIALIVAACGDEEGDPSATEPDGASEATTTETPQTSQQAADAAFAAALKLFDGVGEADCETNNPQSKNCISSQSDQSTVHRGIAVFGVGDPAGGGGYVGVLGQGTDGEWNVWLETQNAYQLLMLPGSMLICAEGESLNVRSAPAIDATVAGSLDDLTSVRAEQFVLTEPAGDEGNGYGWYQLSEPLDGWAYSKNVANARSGDCMLRDAQEAPSP